MFIQIEPTSTIKQCRSAAQRAISSLLMISLMVFCSANTYGTDTTDYNIPAGNLGKVLTQFGAQTGLLFTFDPAITKNKKSEGLKGRFTPEQGLQQLLDGSGLRYRYISTDTVTLELATRDEALILSPIIVKGERLERTVKETASSVSVTTDAKLEVLPGPNTLDTIFDQTPNVTLTGQGNEGPTIRGLSTSGILTSVESFFGGSQPRSTVQVDGRQITFSEFVYARESTWDIEAVEVFRGPQTTSQGRNSIAGAINIRTANPNHEEFTGEVRAIGGEHSTRQVSGVVSGPIGDGQLAYRLSGDRRTFESFVTPLGVTEDLGVDLRDDQTTTLRGKLSWQPDNIKGLEALFTYSYTDTQRQQTDLVDMPFQNRTRTNPAFPVFETQADGVIAEISYAFNNALSIKNTTTYSDVNVARIAPVGTGNAEINSDDITNEFILQYKGDNISVLSGIYYSSFNSEEQLDLSGFRLGIGDFEEKRESKGIFADFTWSITSKLDVSAGGRWQEDSQDRDGGFVPVVPIDFDETFSEFLPKFEIAYDLSNDIRIGGLVEKGFNAGGFTFNFDTFSEDQFSEETLWNYELFLRSSFLDGRLELNGNIFHTKYDDLQISTSVEVAPDFFANVFSNVAKANSTGAEIDSVLRVNEELTLEMALGYTTTEFDSNSNAGALINGNEFQRAPRLSVSVGAIWQPIEDLTLSAFARHTDDYYSDDANIEANKVDSFSIVDLQARYYYGDSVSFILSVTNLFDEFNELIIFDNGSTASVTDPRRVTLGVQFYF